MSASVAAALPRSAQAYDFWLFRTNTQRLVEQAQDARARGEYERAEALLVEAEREAERAVPEAAHERGLILRDLGRLEEAVDKLRVAADLQRESGARVDQAGVLVELGRWPEAVTILRQAFDERGSDLAVDAVVRDPRFVKLARFAPYEELLDEVRAEQAGPIGRTLMRLERLESTVRGARAVFDQVAVLMTFVGRLLAAVSAAAVSFVLLGLLLTFGVSQVGLLRPPWTLITGMLVASGLWHWGVRVASAGEETGLATITTGLIVVFAPWTVVALGVWSWRWVRARRRPRVDPFSPSELAATVAIFDELARQGRRVLEGSEAERAVARSQLQAARRALYQRLGLRIRDERRSAETDGGGQALTAESLPKRTRSA